MNNLDPKTFFFELPLYAGIKITQENISDFEELFSDSKRIDYYNPTLGENSTYEVSPIYNNHLENLYETGGWAYGLLRCVRTSEECHVFYSFDSDSKVLIKIGQNPSVATFHISQIKQYNKVLSKEKLKEFTRAIGLAANGVGIGSFVYLRRIFEGLIGEAHTKAGTQQGWDEEYYGKSRMADRIEMLKDYLPAFLVENKTLYGILSVGIHSLTEEDCLAYFETVKVGIELILDEKLEAFEKQKKIDDARQKINALTGKIKGQ